MVRQTATVVTLELIGGILLLAVAAVVALAVMLASGPVELNIFRADVERALEEARDGRDVSIERLTLQWLPSDRQMVVTAEGLTLRDESGAPAGKADQAFITLDAGSLVFGKPEVLQTRLAGGRAEVRQVSPTRWTFAGEPLPEFEARTLPENPEEWLGLANRVLGEILVGLEATRRSGSLESAEFEDFELRFIQQSDAEFGTMTNASGSFVRGAGGLEVNLAGSGGGLGLPGDLHAKLVVPAEYDRLILDVGIDQWSLGDLALRAGVNEERLSGFPADIVLGLEYEPGEGLVRIGLSADADAGQILIGEAITDVEELSFDVAYDPDVDELQINSLNLTSDKFAGTLQGLIEKPVTSDMPIGFNLRSEELTLDLTPYFPTVWQISAASFDGTLARELDQLTLNAFAFDTSGARFSGEVTASLPGEDDVAGDFPGFVDVKADVEGDLGVRDVLNFWPETLGEGARRFAANRITEGKATTGTLRMTLKPDSFADGYLRDEDLEANFFVEGARVKFLDDLPAVTDGVGSARLTGNGFSVQLNSAEYGGWQLTEGAVQFPRFNPKGELFRVYAKGNGPAVNAMRTLSESRLRLQETTGFDPERVSGDAEMTFEMFRPALDDVPMEELDITVSGTVTNGGLKDALPGLNLVDAEVNVQLEDMNLILTGFGDVGPAPVQFTWRDDLNDEGAPANLSASAFISPDFLNRFGFVGRAYVSGDIPVELQALVAADGVETVEIGFELQQSRIDVSEIGWIKPAGQAARATLSFDAKREMSASTFVFNSDSARFDGDVELADTGQLQSLIVREAYLADFLDVSGEISRNEDDGFVSTLSGAFLDASAFFGDFGSVGGGGFSVPLTLDADLETLRLRKDVDLRQARLSFASSKTGVREVSARGAIGDGAGTMEAVYVGPTAENAATIRLNSDDAGFFMRGFMGQDFLSGGRLSLTGRLARGNDPARLNLALSNVRMSEAPFLTQVLSLASLRGLADTLSGEGVLFTNIEVPLTIAGDRFIVEGARANGPALGLTLNGWFEQPSNEIRISGVLVPSFGVNSMLGGVPIIGDLFVGREGEGIFSLTYSVRGTLDKAQVTINPLSAVTPGILRRIFENPADTSIPDSLPTDPNLTPPAPPMGDEEFIPSAPGSNP
ncbi:MAG: DUF3971 domain-containing protein [Henriciella sp.]